MEEGRRHTHRDTLSRWQATTEKQDSAFARPQTERGFAGQDSPFQREPTRRDTAGTFFPAETQFDVLTREITGLQTERRFTLRDPSLKWTLTLRKDILGESQPPAEEGDSSFQKESTWRAVDGDGSFARNTHSPESDEDGFSRRQVRCVRDLSGIAELGVEDEDFSRPRTERSLREEDEGSQGWTREPTQRQGLGTEVPVTRADTRMGSPFTRPQTDRVPPTSSRGISQNAGGGFQRPATLKGSSEAGWDRPPTVQDWARQATEMVSAENALSAEESWASPAASWPAEVWKKEDDTLAKQAAAAVSDDWKRQETEASFHRKPPSKQATAPASQANPAAAASGGDWFASTPSVPGSKANTEKLLDPAEAVNKFSASGQEWFIAESEIDFSAARLLGNGDICKVFACKFKERPVAVKILRLENQQDTSWPRFAVDFANELEVRTAKLGGDHPNIVPFLGAGTKTVAGRQFPAMLLAQMQGTVEQLVVTKGEKPPRAQALGWCRDLLAALHHLHSLPGHAMAHMDVCPDNLLLSADMATLQLGDFSMATPADSPGPRVWFKLGSLRYTAPEVVISAEEAPDHGTAPDLCKVDIFAAAMCCWAMAHGKRPFGDIAEMAVRERIGNDERPPLEAPYSEGPFAQVLGYAWHSDHAKRPQAGGIAKAFEVVFKEAGGGALARPETGKAKGCFSSFGRKPKS